MIKALLTILAWPTLFVLAVWLFGLRPQIHVAPYLAIVVALAAFALRYMPRSDFRVFWLYICGFALFNGLRTLADTTGNPTNFAYPIAIDRAFFGVVPTVWLQEQFFVVGRIGILEWATVIVYMSYFSAHYWVAVIVWAFKRDLLVQHVGAIVATVFIGLILYYAVPTSPPWFAAQTGHLSEVFRISPIVTDDISKTIYERGSYIAGSNDVAAMPSLHTALTAVIAMTLWRIHKVVGAAGWAYLALMGFSLVYLGEHYVVDVVAGVVTAVAAWKLTYAVCVRYETRKLEHPSAAAQGPSPIDEALRRRAGLRPREALAVEEAGSSSE